ncbi:MAG: hypothetical protein IJL97_06015 [Lachnospiraceae bacterium]|nr:hypothetical protein [Lachnospiraceae bacterium]
MKRLKGAAIVLLCLVVCIACLSGCGSSKESETQAPTETGTQETEKQTESQVQTESMTETQTETQQATETEETDTEETGTETEAPDTGAGDETGDETGTETGEVPQSERQSITDSYDKLKITLEPLEAYTVEKTSEHVITCKLEDEHSETEVLISYKSMENFTEKQVASSITSWIEYIEEEEYYEVGEKLETVELTAGEQVIRYTGVKYRFQDISCENYTAWFNNGKIYVTIDVNYTAFEEEAGELMLEDLLTYVYDNIKITAID